MITMLKFVMGFLGLGLGLIYLKLLNVLDKPQGLTEALSSFFFYTATAYLIASSLIFLMDAARAVYG